MARLPARPAADDDRRRRRVVGGHDARNFESLLDYSERDTLTGLLNRKTFDAAFLQLSLPQADSAACEAESERRHACAAQRC